MRNDVKTLPSADELRRMFRYDAETGILYWRHRSDARPQWNAKYADRPAGNAMNGKVKVSLAGFRLMMAHRIIWKLVYGEEPPAEIDHANCIATDNRLSNLRAATRKQNMRNRRGRAASGFKGASLHRASGLWRSRIRVNGREVFLGYFRTAKSAHEAYAAAAREHFGEFARIA